MIELVIPAPLYDELVGRLTVGSLETCAVLLLAPGSEGGASTSRVLCREAIYPLAEDYLHRSEIAAELAPQFVAAITKRAKVEGLILAFVHSHPGDETPKFSPTDDEGEQALTAFLAHRLPEGVHCAVVMSNGGVRARVLGTEQEVSVLVVGSTRRYVFRPTNSSAESAKRFDRQVRAFGRDGQQALQQLTVGIVGLGGTGSVIAQQLAHLGVRRFILIDPDTIEISNLNRVVGATSSDVGRPKVSVAQDMVKAIEPAASIETMVGDVTYARIATSLLPADCMFGCTDSHGSRAVLQQIAFQYLIPCIDMGVTITADKSQVTGAFGRIQLLAPGFGCFTCGGLLDSEQVRRDMMNEFERRTDPYIVGNIEPAPAVISINSAVASYAINMFLATFIELPFAGRQLILNLLANSIRVVTTPPRTDCHICSLNGALARGVTRRLAARMD